MGISAHFIDSKTDKVLFKRVIFNAPRINDEVRFGEELFYTVHLIVWVYDEPDCPFERVNIGVSRIEL